MASNTYGAIKLSTAEDVGAVLKKKTGSQDGYKPKEWADTINLMGLLPVRTASGSIAHFTDGADAVPFKSLTAQILSKQSGTGTPSPSNPRPISGTSVLNVNRVGKNLFDEANATMSNLSLSNHVFTNTNTDTRANLQFQAVLLDDNLQAIQSLFSQSVTATGAFSRTVTITNSGYSKLMIKHNGSAIDLRIIVPFTYPKKTVTISANFLGVDVQTVGGLSFENLQIEIGSTATTYEPYTGSTYTVNFGQTVYGGSADVVGGTGSKTMAEIDLGDLSWTKQTMQNGSGFTARIEDGEPIGNVNSSGALCEIYPEDISVQNPYYIADETFKYGGTYFGKRNVTILDSTKENMTASEFKIAMTGTKFAYPLETPTEYTFTGQPINSYLGVNNVWTDSGEVLDVEYRADMNLLIAELGG